MKTKNDRQYYIIRGVKRFVSLVYYFNITRPKAEKAYFKDGKFSIKELQRQIRFLNDWEKKTRTEKRLQAKIYAEYSKTYNFTFGIPNRLIQKVLGEYKDDNGIRHKISVEEIEGILISKGFIRVIESGKKFNRDEEGNYNVKCWWNKKYLIANEKLWLKLLASDRYNNWWDYIKEDKGMAKVMEKWIASYRKPKEHTTPEQASDTSKKTFEKHTYSTAIIRSLVQFGMIGIEDAYSWFKDFGKVEYTQAQIEAIHNTKDCACSREVFFDRVLSKMLDIGFTATDGLYQLIEYTKQH